MIPEYGGPPKHVQYDFSSAIVSYFLLISKVVNSHGIFVFIFRVLSLNHSTPIFFSFSYVPVANSSSSS